MIERFQEIIENIVQTIEKSSNIIIVTHTNPDGDAIGSALALYFALKSKNKNVNVISDDSFPENLKFMEGAEKIIRFDKEKDYFNFLMADTILILDLNDPKRLKSLQQYVENSGAKKILIDHHIEPQKFVDIELVDTDATSTGELIWKLLKSLSVEISKPIAEALYIAIMTDTGNFRHFRTDSDTFRTVAELIDFGADPVDLYDNVYNNNSLAGTKLLGEALRSIELYYDGLVSIILIPASIIGNSGANQSDIDSFVDKTLSVKGVQIGVLLADIAESDEVRISFRSKNAYSVRELAASFGGGGHTHAAGARVRNSDVYKVRDIIINRIKELCLIK